MPSPFHLTHFPTQHFVLGLGIAAEVDAIDIGTLAWIHHEGDIDGVIVIVRLRHAVDVGEGVAIVTQATGNQLGSGGHQLAREHLPFLYQQQRLDLVFRHFQVTAELDVTNAVLLAFVDIDGDVDVFLSGVMDTWVEAISMLI